MRIDGALYYSRPMRQAVLTPKGVERVKSGHLWIYRSDVAAPRPPAATSSKSLGPRGRPLGAAFYSDRSQIALRLLTRGGSAARSRLAARAADAAPGDSASRSPSTPPPIGSSTAKATCCRRSSSTATATISSCRRCRRRPTGCCPTSSRLLQELVAPSRSAILARNDGRVRALEGLPTSVEVVAGGVPERVEVREGARPVRGRSVQGPEDRALPRSAREPRGGGALRARPAARLLQLQRRLRAGAGAALQRRRRARDLGRRQPPHSRQRGAERHRSARGADRQRLRRAARARSRRRALRHDRARSAGVREEQGRRCRRPRPATRKSTCARCACSRRAASSSPAPARITSTKCCSRTSSAAPRPTPASRCRIVEKRTQGRDHPVLLGVPETRYLKCLILRKL